VSNPSALFLSQHDNQVPGSCVMVTQEGTRPLLVEIQALVDASHQPNARAAVGRSGAEPAGHAAGGAAPPCRHRAFDQDVFINAVGGSRLPNRRPTWRCCWRLIRRCATSRCRAASWCLAKWGWPARSGRRRAAGAFARGGQAGLSIAMIPTANAPKQPIEGMTIISVDRIDDAFNKLREIQ
jgi:DNA repair protein RadA/Sms